jgi:hypothetical protein
MIYKLVCSKMYRRVAFLQEVKHAASGEKNIDVNRYCMGTTETSRVVAQRREYYNGFTVFEPA